MNFILSILRASFFLNILHTRIYPKKFMQNVEILSMKRRRRKNQTNYECTSSLQACSRQLMIVIDNFECVIDQNEKKYPHFSSQQCASECLPRAKQMLHY